MSPQTTPPNLAITMDSRSLAKELSGRHCIDGQLVEALSGKTFDVIYPATLEVIGHAADGDEADVNSAVQAAARAQPSWAHLPARQRGKLVQECARLLDEHAEELARLMVLETGKALRTECRIEAGSHADVYCYYGGLASELKGETVPFSHDMLVYTTREPLGVVAAIIAWNVPLLLMALKVAPALVAGNTVVCKSAEEAPLTVLRAAQLMNQILPPGVFNLIHGDGPSCGAPLAEHPLVAKVTLTGSVGAGKSVALAAARKLIPATLELGGKSPMLVLADADLDRAVQGAVTSMRFTRQGQSCSAASRIIVHRSLHDEFLIKLKSKVDMMVMGDPMDEATDIGTIVSPAQFATVQRYIALGEATPNAVAHRCSHLPMDPRLAAGLFVQPVVFSGLPDNSPLVLEEIFGPVTVVLPFETYEEAIAMANNTNYGLAATVWTRDLARALDAVQRLQAGFVQVNQNLVVQAGLSYGGTKQSGIGREADLAAMLHSFTTTKTVLVNIRS